MNPRDDLSACDWEAARAAYLDRFGPLFEARPAAEDKGPPFWILTFWDPARPGAPVVYASLGAPAGDMFLTAVSPGFGLGGLLEDAALAAPRDLKPPAVLSAGVEWTTLGGVIVLPDGEGGFDVRAADGSVRRVRQVVAVTTWERIRAELRSPARVLPAILAAGGRVADVLRECTVQPKRTRSFRALGAPAHVRRMRRWVADLEHEIADLRAGAAPVDAQERLFTALRAGLAHYEAALPHVPTDAEHAARLAAATEHERRQLTLELMVERGLDRIVSQIPGERWALDQFRTLLVLVIATHPDARPLFDAVVDGRETPSAPPDLSPTEHRERLLSCVSEAAEILGGLRPDRGAGALAALALSALGKPRDRDDSEYEPVLTASTGWPIAVRAMIEEVFPSSTQDERAVIAAYKIGLTVCGRIDRKVEGTVPAERLASMCKLVAFHMLYGYAMGQTRDPVGAGTRFQ